MASALQNQFPLSPKKFWKKVIEKVPICIIVSVAISYPVYFIFHSVIASQNIYTGIIAAALFAIVLSLVFICIYAVYVHYYIKQYYYSDDADFLTIKKGVFAPTEIHVQYMKIQDVYVDQDILDRIMGLYDVHISSATYSSGMEAHIDGVEKSAADGLKTLLLGKIKSSTSGGSMSQAANSEAHKEVAHEVKQEQVHFSSPISSDAYGLSKNWWISEAIKLVISSLFIATILTFWLFGFSLKEGLKEGGLSFALSVWVGVLILALIARAITLWLWQMHYRYEFGAEYIYMKNGILSVSEKNMGYNTVQDVKVDQTFIDRIFGVASIHIENAAQSMVPVQGRYGKVNAPVSNGITIVGLSVDDARKIAEEMKRIVIHKTTARKGV